VKEPSENSDLNKKFENFAYPVDDTNWDAISMRIPSGKGVGFLGEKFSTYTVSPSAGVWRGIEASLQPGARRRIAAWWWYGAAAAVFLFGYLAFMQIDTPENQMQIVHKETETSMESKSGVGTAMPDSGSIAPKNNNTESNSASAEAITITSTVSKASTNKTENEKGPIKSESSHPGNIAQTDHITWVAEDVRDFPNTEKESFAGNISKMSGGTDRIILRQIAGVFPGLHLPIHTAELAGEMSTLHPMIELADNKKQKSSPFYDGTETSSVNQVSILAGSQLAFAGNGEMDMAESSYSGISTSLNPSEGLGLSNSSIPVSVNYSTPVYYGVNGEIKFWKRFSGGLGLGYLHMQTTANFRYALQSEVRETESKYLSIPVYIKFNFVDKPKYTAYGTAGNSIDFLIWQKTTETYSDGQNTEIRSVNNDVKGNQANIYAGIGTSFKFTNHIGIFAEGSLMQYYSITGTNFYSQKTLWPGMRFGVLVSF